MMHDAEKKEPDREAIKIHIAILIGISTYDKPEQNLPSAVRDVELLRYCLNGYYDEIYTITSKGASEIFDKDRHSEVLSASDTRNRVEAIFQQICEKYSMAPTLFWVHFSGHGSDDEKEQWIFEHPGDANPGEERVYFSAKFVMDVARHYTRRLFMTIDACRNGDRVSRTANEAPEGIYCLEPEMPDSLVEIDPRLIEGYCYFGACAPGRKTHESINAEIGPFTASIVEAVREGLEGKGDVTVGQMIAKFQRDSLLPSTSHGNNMFDQALLVRWRPPILWDTVFVGTEADLNNLQFKLRELPSTNKCFHNYQYLPGLAKRPWPQMRVGAPLWIFWSCPVATVGIMFLLKHERSTAADFVHYINMLMKNNPATTIILDCRLTEKDVQYLHELLDYKVRFVYWKDNFHNRNEQNSLFKHIKFDNELNIPAIDSIDQIAQLGPGNSEKPNVTSEDSKIVIENLLKQGAFVPFEVLEATDVHTVCLERSSRKVSKILIIGSGEDAWEAFFQYTVAALSRNIDLVAIFGKSFTAIKDVLTDAINQMIARPHDLTICFCGRFEMGLNNHYPLMQVKDQLFNFIEGIYDKIGKHDELKRYDKAIEVCVFDSGYGLQDLASNADAFVVIPNPYVFTTRILDLQRHSNSVLPFALLSNAGWNGNHQAEIKSFFTNGAAVSLERIGLIKNGEPAVLDENIATATLFATILAHKTWSTRFKEKHPDPANTLIRLLVEQTRTTAATPLQKALRPLWLISAINTSEGDARKAYCLEFATTAGLNWPNLQKYVGTEWADQALATTLHYTLAEPEGRSERLGNIHKYLTAVAGQISSSSLTAKTWLDLLLPALQQLVDSPDPAKPTEHDQAIQTIREKLELRSEPLRSVIEEVDKNYQAVIDHAKDELELDRITEELRQAHDKLAERDAQNAEVSGKLKTACEDLRDAQMHTERRVGATMIWTASVFLVVAALCIVFWISFF